MATNANECLKEPQKRQLRLPRASTRSLAAVLNGQKHHLQKGGIQFANRMPLMDTFTFLIITRPLEVRSNVSAGHLHS